MRSLLTISVLVMMVLTMHRSHASMVKDTASLVLYNATVLDIHSGDMHAMVSITISDSGIITSIAPSASSPPSSAGRIIDCSGQYIIPGLIDGHVHASSDWPQNDTLMTHTLEWLLRGGVTSMRDMAGDVLWIAPFAQRATIAVVASPRIYYSALIGGPDFFLDPRVQDAAHGYVAGSIPWLRAVVNDTNCEQAIREARQIGCTGIKIYGDLTGERAAAITAAANKQSRFFCE